MPNNRPAPSSNSTLPMEGAVINELYYTGQGDPRHKCVAIGYHRNEPVVYKFDTVDLPQGTRTTVSASAIGSSQWTHQIADLRPPARFPPALSCPPHLLPPALGPATLQVTYNEQSVVAFFDWALATHLGAMIRGGEREPMTDLVMPGSTETFAVSPTLPDDTLRLRFTRTSARMFTSGRDEKEKFEWRRIGDKHPYGYEVGRASPHMRDDHSRECSP